MRIAPQRICQDTSKSGRRATANGRTTTSELRNATPQPGRGGLGTCRPIGPVPSAALDISVDFLQIGSKLADMSFTETGHFPRPAAARTGDWMQTASGRQFWPLDPRADEIHIEDIAAALSKLCRYGGHCKRFYSVAEHCVLMAHTAPDGLHLAALMHDASEAYLSDVIRPIKRHLQQYVEIEAALERVITRRFCLKWPMPAEVKELDERIIADEQAQVMAPPPVPWREREPALGVTIQFWTPEKAEFEFLAAFRRYGGHWC